MCIPACTGQESVSAQGGVCPGGCLPWEVSTCGVFAQGVFAQGGCLRGEWVGGGVCPVHAGIHTPPHVNRMTDACENITFPQLRYGR